MREIVFSVSEIHKLFMKSMLKVPRGRLGVAVSGGSDSMALLYLSSDWAKKNGTKLAVISVDHGLRSESRIECEIVKRQANALKLTHTTARWNGKSVKNLQESARNARHDLIRSWAYDENLAAVLFAHTLDDNAENFILRLLRGSGVDGLSGISSDITFDGLRVCRPLLNISRESLRSYLTKIDVPWIDDPSNSDEKFQRVKIRRVLSELKAIGLSPNRLVATANHMSRAQEVLVGETVRFSKESVIQEDWGGLSIDVASFCHAMPEIQLRILSAGLKWVAGRAYRPRFCSLEKLLIAIQESKLKKPRTLMGVVVSEVNGKITLIREFSAVPKKASLEGIVNWDRKWQLIFDLEYSEQYSVGPLGEDGLNDIENYREYGIPRAALLSSVALFRKERLVCLPLISYGFGLRTRILGGDQSFYNSLYTY